jgi:ABC-type sugar transport system ATPase subunit
VLELVHVTKTFGHFKALDAVCMAVHPGTVHGLVGENGAGKSTLIKILNGQYPTSSFSGDLLLDGDAFSLSSPEDARRKGIAAVPQETSVIDTMTVAENLVLGRWPGGRLIRQSSILREARSFLDDVGIHLRSSSLAGELSASSKQLLMIARALYAQPRMLLLDEPTTALTHAEVDNLYSIVNDLRGRGVTVLLISHKLEEIFHLCDTVSVLRDGELVDSIAREDLSRERLVKSMTGKDLAHLFPERQRTAPGGVVLRAANLRTPDPRVPGRLAVNDVSLEVRAGEVVGIGGPLGSGRSELLLALMGGLPRHGTVELGDRQLPAANPAAAAKAGLVLVPEERKTEGLLFNLDIAANVSLSALGRVLTGGILVRKREASEARHAIERFRIAGATPRGPLTSLSGGNQQKVLLSRAIFTQPRVILLDEPTKGVDIAAKSEIYELIGRLAEEGLAVIMVSSELPELLGNCDRILMMSGGRIAREFDATHTTREQLLEAAMSGSAKGHDTTATESEATHA